jgi:hypothetical protein
MKKRSWKRTERYGLKPIEHDYTPYRAWCAQNDFDPEDTVHWIRWLKTFTLEQHVE